MSFWSAFESASRRGKTEAVFLCIIMNDLQTPDGTLCGHLDASAMPVMDKGLWARPGAPGTPDHVAGPQIRGSFSGYYRGYGGKTCVVTRDCEHLGRVTECQ